MMVVWHGLSIFFGSIGKVRGMGKDTRGRHGKSSGRVLMAHASVGSYG